jgi:hypothetical protein
MPSTLVFGTVVPPLLHQHEALVEQVAPPVRCFNLVWQAMRQRVLAYLAREIVALPFGAPIAKRRNENHAR